MPNITKTIVDKSLINADPCLKVIKAFRIANKRIGECTKAVNMASANGDEAAAMQAAMNRQMWLVELNRQGVNAARLGFKIWVNNGVGDIKGKTGHSYDKDYKVTPEEWNVLPEGLSDAMPLAAVTPADEGDDNSPEIDIQPSEEPPVSNRPWNAENDRNL